MDSLDALRTFRDSLYRCFDRRADALFELTDALLTASVIPSPVHLSLQPSHRRSWGSLYAALSRGRIDEDAVRELVAHHPLTEDHTPPVSTLWTLVSGAVATQRPAPSGGTITIP